MKGLKEQSLPREAISWRGQRALTQELKRLAKAGSDDLHSIGRKSSKRKACGRLIQPNLLVVKRLIFSIKIRVFDIARE